MNAVLAGAWRQALIETRIQLFTLTGLSWIIWPVIGLVVMFFLRDTSVMGSAVSLAQLGIPGIVTMYLVTGGLLGIAGGLVQEREDGTLLRAKSVPHGMAAHLIGSIGTYGAVSLLPTLALAVGAHLVVPGLGPTGPGGWLLFAGVAVLGLLATMPIGAVLGAVARGPMAIAFVAMVSYAAMAISGVFYPLGALPTWLQWIGQALPTYWVGLGMRAAMLPPEAAALEVDGSFRLAGVVVALLAWAVLGLAFAPAALRRMARRQSGSIVAAARDRVMTKGY